jgi:antitoxin VapB
MTDVSPEPSPQVQRDPALPVEPASESTPERPDESQGILVAQRPPAPSELDVKIGRLRELLDERKLEGLLLRRAANFAWATCGATASVDVADTFGQASLLVTRTAQYVITDNIEARRLHEEEHLSDQGWEFHIVPWHEQDGSIPELVGGMAIGSDSGVAATTDLQREIAGLRCTLLPEEIRRFRAICRLAAEAIDGAILSIHPGLTENFIAGLLAREALSRGLEPIVHLVGTDERAMQYRHALPTEKRLQKYAMLVLCARKQGLVASLTRAVYFGRLPDDLRKKEGAVAHVDAHFIAATRPGRRLSQIFHEGMQAYQYYGYPGEWKNHHQGGLAGYLPREIVATLDTEQEVAVGQVYAWNPSIEGTKSEDSILVREQDNEVLTTIPRWPVIRVNLRGQTIDRPRILEIA